MTAIGADNNNDWWLLSWWWSCDGEAWLWWVGSDTVVAFVFLQVYKLYFSKYINYISPKVSIVCCGDLVTLVARRWYGGGSPAHTTNFALSPPISKAKERYILNVIIVIWNLLSKHIKRDHTEITANVNTTNFLKLKILMCLLWFWFWVE